MRSKEFINEEDDREFARKLDKYYRDRAAKSAATKAKHSGVVKTPDHKSGIMDKAKDFWAKHGYGIKKAADEFNRWQQSDLRKSTLK